MKASIADKETGRAQKQSPFAPYLPRICSPRIDLALGRDGYALEAPPEHMVRVRGRALFSNALVYIARLVISGNPAPAHLKDEVAAWRERYSVSEAASQPMND